MLMYTCIYCKYKNTLHAWAQWSYTTNMSRFTIMQSDFLEAGVLIFQIKWQRFGYMSTIGHNIKTICLFGLPEQLWPLRTRIVDLCGCPVVPGTKTLTDPLGLVGCGVGPLFRCIQWMLIELGLMEFGQVIALGFLSCSSYHESWMVSVGGGGGAHSWRVALPWGGVLGSAIMFRCSYITIIARTQSFPADHLIVDSLHLSVVFAKAEVLNRKSLLLRPPRMS